MPALLTRRLLRASGRALLPFAFAAGALGVTGASLVGCDQADAATADDAALSLSSAANAGASATAPESLLTRITRELSLTAAQAALVRTTVTAPQAGGLWTLTAALAPTLSADQTARLQTFPAPPSGSRPPQGPPSGGRPPQGPPQGDRPAPPSEADRAADQAAMQAALGLTDAQLTALAALPRPAPPVPGTLPPSGPVAVPDAVKALLNADQQALFAVHHGLVLRLMPSPPPGGPR